MTHHHASEHSDKLILIPLSDVKEEPLNRHVALIKAATLAVFCYK